MKMYWYKLIFGIIISVVLITLLQTYMYMSHDIMNDCTRRHPMAGDVRVAGIEKHTSKTKLFSSQGDGVSSYNADNNDTVWRGHNVSNNVSGDGDDVDFRVIVIGYNRAASLQRLLDSINNAQYYGDRTIVEVWLDKSKDGVIDNTTLQTALRFSFRHGRYKVFTHPRHVGIYGQWLSTWQPSPHSPEIAAILEDDLVVSPHYYRYLKLVHAKYGHDPHINGFALQGYSVKHNGQPGHVVGPNDKHVFLYPTIGTWGFSPNRKHWMNFLEWFSLTYTNTWFQPCVRRHISTTWYRKLLRDRRADSMWSMWHIYYAWKHDEFTLYPNLEGQKGLTVNCKEPGLHHDGNRGTCIPVNGLLTQWKLEYEQLPDNPPTLDNFGTTI